MTIISVARLGNPQAALPVLFAPQYRGKIGGAQLMSVNFNANTEYPLADRTNPKFLKVNCARFNALWHLIENPAGTYTLNGNADASVANLMNMVNTCAASGVEPYMHLGYGNGFWKNPAEPSDNFAYPSCFRWPAGREAYARFAGYMAAQTRGLCRTFHTPNEPDTGAVWNNPATPLPDANAIFETLKVMGPAIRNANPNARVIVGEAHTAANNSTFTQPGLLSLPWYDYADGISFHGYHNQSQTPEMWFLGCQGLVAQCPSNRLIIMSEAGHTYGFGHPQAQKYSARWFLLMRCLPIDMQNYYVATDVGGGGGSYGVLRNDWTDWPEGDSGIFRTMQDYLIPVTGARMYRMGMLPGQQFTSQQWNYYTHYVRLDQNGPQQKFAVWNPMKTSKDAIAVKTDTAGVLKTLVMSGTPLTPTSINIPAGVTRVEFSVADAPMLIYRDDNPNASLSFPNFGD